MVKQHRCLKYLPTLANTNIYASSKSQGIFLLQDVLNVSLSVQNSERALISLAGSFSRPLNALTYLANLAINSFFSSDFTDFPAFPENLVQGGRTNAFFFPPASKAMYKIAESHCQSGLFVVLRISCDLLALVAGGEHCEQGHNATQGPRKVIEPNECAGATAQPLARSRGPGLE